MNDKYKGSTPGKRALGTGHEFQDYHLEPGQISHVLYGNVKGQTKTAIALFFHYNDESNKNALLALDAPMLAKQNEKMLAMLKHCAGRAYANNEPENLKMIKELIAEVGG
jgi:hypothetical protein